MKTDPRRISDDQIETAGGCDIGEMGRKGKGKRGAAPEIPLAPRRILDLRAQSGEAELRVPTWWMSLAEQILCAGRQEQLLAHCCEARPLALKLLDRRISFGAIHRARERSLP